MPYYIMLYHYIYLIKDIKCDNNIIQPGEKFEFSMLMHEINVLTY